MKTAVLLFFLVWAQMLQVQAIHFFNGTYEEALKKAKAENKHLFIDFTASWCGPCRMMKKTVFENHRVIRYTDEHYICLLADIEFPEYGLLQQRVNPDRAGSIPHLCILTPDEKVLKEAGSLTVGQMLKFLNTATTGTSGRPLLAADTVPPLPIPPHLFQHRTPYSQVLEQAKRENKNMILCFSSHFCGPCRQMEKTTFRNPQIMEWVDNRFAAGYFEVGNLDDRALCYRYHNTTAGIPYLILATPDEKIIRKQYGYMDSTAFMDFLQPSSVTIDSISPQTFSFREKDPSFLAKFFYNQMHHAWKLRITAGIDATTLKTGGTLSDWDFNYRTGYQFGFTLAREGRHFAVAPGLFFISKGGKQKDLTLRQNYLELPVKLSWIYWNNYRAHWKGLSIIPYGSVRIGEKLKTTLDGLADELFATRRFDYGMRFATNIRLNSFDFEAGYMLGLNNLSDYAGGKLYNRGFFLNMSLCF